MGMERANYDMLIFAILWASIVLLFPLTEKGAYLAVLGLFLTKVYPFVAISSLLRASSGSRRWFWGSILSALVLAILSFQDLRLTAANTPQVVDFSFGYPVGFLWLSESAGFFARLARPALVVFIVMALWWSWPKRRFLVNFLAGVPPHQERLFIAGGAIFAACFAMGASFYYRYTLMLLPLPALFSISQLDGWRKRIASYLLIAIYSGFWLPRITALKYHGGVLHILALVAGALQEMCNWLLFGFFLTCVVAVVVNRLSWPGGGNGWRAWPPSKT
jgi:hypothetical protein